MFYYMALMKSELISKGKGGTQKNISQTVLNSLDVIVPPLPEQERIVARIEELFSQLDAGLETLKKTKAQLAVYRQAVLKEAFDSVSEYGNANIESLCQSIVDCPHSTPKWSEDGYLCLRTTNFKRGRLDLSEKNYVTKEIFDIRNTRLVPLPGDVLYSREGAILGIACIIPENTYVCLGQRMMLLRPGEKLNNRYLMHFLNSPALTTFVASITGGSASPHVNVREIKAFMIPCPDIEIQKRIVLEIDSKLSVCDSIEQTVDAALQQAEAMRQSILNRAFEGCLY
jgi:type I restriction enzyme S subunit